MTKPAWTAGLKWPEIEARQHRMARIEDGFTIRGMIFQSTLDVVRRDLGAGEVSEVLGKANITESRFAPLRNYSLREFMELQTVVAQRLTPALGSFEAAVARTGAAAVEVFFDSIAGRTMKVLAGSEPHRLLSAAPNGYTLAIHDPGKRHYDKTDDRSGVFSFVDDLLGPCHQIGTFLAAIRGACGINANIRVDQSTYTNYKLHVSW